MFLQERQLQIAEHIRLNKRSTVNELSDLFKVSVDTIRRDLSSLEKENLIVRTHGGAVYSESGQQKLAFPVRKKLFTDTKKSISNCASKFISNNDVIYIDGSSTLLSLLPSLEEKRNLTIITNSVYIAAQIQDLRLDVVLFFIGGKILNSTGCAIGSKALKDLQNYRIDKAFLSCCGFTIEEGFFDTDVDEAVYKNTLFNLSKKSYILLDDTKFENTSVVFLTKAKKEHTIITNKGLSADYINRFHDECEAELIIADDSE